MSYMPGLSDSVSCLVLIALSGIFKVSPISYLYKCGLRTINSYCLKNDAFLVMMVMLKIQQKIKKVFTI